MSFEPKKTKDIGQKADEQESHYMRLVVLLFIPVLLLAIAAPLLWNLSQQNKDASVSVTHYTLSNDEIASLADAAGYSATGNEVTSILLVVTPKEEEQLSNIALITVDDTESSAKLIEINPSEQVACDGQTESLEDTYVSSGSQGVAYAVAHAGLLSVDHIVEMDDSGWDILRGAVEAGSDSLSVDVTQLLEGIKENDMSVSTIREVLTRALDYGFSAKNIVQVSSTDGLLDAAQIGIFAGSVQ